MPDDRRTELVPSEGGFFAELSQRVRLVIRLMRDERVSPILKLMPVASLVYLFVPDLAPGPIDDAAVIWLGGYLFVELCPPDVVEEHIRALNAVIDAEFHPMTEKTPSGQSPQLQRGTRENSEE